MEQIWFHVDLDAFYASVEQLDNPQYRGKPVIVGGQSNRGVVSACSYEARKFKVHSAMPTYRAKQLCPHAIFVRGRMERYIEVSRQIMTLLKTFSPIVQQISIDEAFLDMSGTQRLFGKPKEAAVLLKNRVRNELGLTISVGIGSSRFIAKMASGYDKPDGLCKVSPGKEIAFVDAVGLQKLWGIGESTLNMLKKNNITTTVELRNYSQEFLKNKFGVATGEYLYKICRGIDPGIHSGVTKSRSISTEMTFPVDVTDFDVLKQNLLQMCHEIMFRALEEDVNSLTVAIKIRLSDFSTTTVQSTGEKPISSAEEAYKIAKELLRKRWKEPNPVRLLGVGFHNVTDNRDSFQQELFDDPYKRKRELEKTVLSLKSSGKSLVKASLLKTKEKDEN
ncbi:MAG: DNA polymerase IV [Sphaerochaetaceae bacterium]